MNQTFGQQDDVYELPGSDGGFEFDDNKYDNDLVIDSVRKSYKSDL
jgi:hypothetical protein